MLPKWHILAGALIATGVWAVGVVDTNAALIIFLASFLIDIDHYLYYIWIKKDINPREAIKWFYIKREEWIKLSPNKRHIPHTRPIFLFHGVGPLILLVIASRINPIFLYVGLGFVIHLILDYIEIIYIKEPLFIKLSPVLVYLSNRTKSQYS